MLDGPKIENNSLVRNKPNNWDKITVVIIIKAAERILVWRAKISLRLFFKKFWAMLYFTV